MQTPPFVQLLSSTSYIVVQFITGQQPNNKRTKDGAGHPKLAAIIRRLGRVYLNTGNCCRDSVWRVSALFHRTLVFAKCRCSDGRWQR